MYGGDGDDIFYADVSQDRVLERSLPGSGHDLIYANENFTLPANVEDLYLEAVALRGIGNNIANLIAGNGNDNILYGMAGNDRLIGVEVGGLDFGAGQHDYLEGGPGADTFVLQKGGSPLYYNNGNDQNAGFAYIADFKASDHDRLELSGGRSNYLLVAGSSHNPGDFVPGPGGPRPHLPVPTGLYFDTDHNAAFSPGVDDLIAVFAHLDGTLEVNDIADFI